MLNKPLITVKLFTKTGEKEEEFQIEKIDLKLSDIVYRLSLEYDYMTIRFENFFIENVVEASFVRGKLNVFSYNHGEQAHSGIGEVFKNYGHFIDHVRRVSHDRFKKVSGRRAYFNLPFRQMFQLDKNRVEGWSLKGNVLKLHRETNVESANGKVYLSEKGGGELLAFDEIPFRFKNFGSNLRFKGVLTLRGIELTPFEDTFFKLGESNKFFDFPVITIR
jgi:hypothetical protein